MNRQKVDKVILWICGTLFTVGGIIHWLIILGVMVERTPLFLTVYFHSLAVFSTMAGIGMFFRKRWGIKIALVICLTQIPAHLYMIYLDVFKNWNSGFGIAGRSIDLGLVSAFLVYIALRKPLRMESEI